MAQCISCIYVTDDGYCAAHGKMTLLDAPACGFHAAYAAADVAMLRRAVAERDELIRDLLERRCRQSCADCEHEEDDGCEFMRRAVEMGVEVYGR